MSHSEPGRVVRMNRLEVNRAASGSGEFARGAADPRLAGVVTGMCAHQRSGGLDVLRWRQAATSDVVLILSIGDRLDVLDMSGGDAAGRSYGSFLRGFHPGYQVLQYEDGQTGLQAVDLTPLGAYQVFGVPASHLASRFVSVEDLAPDLAGSLPERLASLPTWAQRFTLVGEVLAAMADRGPEPDPMVRWMWHQLQASGGRVGISDLVEETGRSHRHVTRRFREQIGLTPKAAAAVVRFEHAKAALSTGTAISLSEVAARYGYADQSHLTREFTRLAGATPETYKQPVERFASEET